MALTQKYGIKYPFTSNNTDEIFIDLNSTFEDEIKSRVLHLIFTPKGQRLRCPDFGTDLINYIFNPSNNETFNNIKEEISSQILKFVPNVEFGDISIYDDENSEHGKIVTIHYTVIKGASKIEESVAVAI